MDYYSRVPRTGSDELPKECPDRIVGRTFLDVTRNDGPWISTVFLGIDHSFGRPGEPVLYATMVFGINEPGSMSENYIERYTNELDAIRGHLTAVEWAIKELEAKRNEQN